MTIDYSPMLFHDCSLLSVSDSIPSPSVSNHAWFSKEKDKRQPHPILYSPMNMLISNVVGNHVDLQVQALQHHPEVNKHYELASQYILTIFPCGYSLA